MRGSKCQIYSFNKHHIFTLLHILPMSFFFLDVFILFLFSSFFLLAPVCFLSLSLFLLNLVARDGVLKLRGCARRFMGCKWPLHASESFINLFYFFPLATRPRERTVGRSGGLSVGRMDGRAAAPCPAACISTGVRGGAAGRLERSACARV